MTTALRAWEIFCVPKNEEEEEELEDERPRLTFGCRSPMRDFIEEIARREDRSVSYMLRKSVEALYDREGFTRPYPWAEDAGA